MHNERKQRKDQQADLIKLTHYPRLISGFAVLLRFLKNIRNDDQTLR
jgi:hypothetical protein